MDIYIYILSLQVSSTQSPSHGKEFRVRNYSIFHALKDIAFSSIHRLFFSFLYELCLRKIEDDIVWVHFFGYLYDLNCMQQNMCQCNTIYKDIYHIYIYYTFMVIIAGSNLFIIHLWLVITQFLKWFISA